MNKEEIGSYILERINKVQKNEVTDRLNYSNGMLFHSVPETLTESSPFDWTNEDQINNLKGVINKFSKNNISFSKIDDGQIGLSDSEYALFFNNGIIESFTPRIVKQTPINFPPKIRYIQVENIVTQSLNFISLFFDLSQNGYSSKSSFTIYITLVGIKGVVFNATEKDYTTTKTFPKDNLTFQINNPNKDKAIFQKSIEEAIHNTLSQYEPVA